MKKVLAFPLRHPWAEALGFITIIAMFIACKPIAAIAQYTTANAHSHNDYNNREPFFKAHKAQFGSIEADVFLRNDTLFVTHDSAEINPRHTLESLYLSTLQSVINSNGGKVYKKGQRLQLLIDIKSEAQPTLTAVIRLLEKYPKLTGSKSNVDIVISGNRPNAGQWGSYPAFIYFDGRPFETYSEAVYKKIKIMSASILYFTKSKELTAEQRENILKFVANGRRLGIKTRLWGVPDTKEYWLLQKELGLDYIGTDNIEGLADFF